MKIRIRNFGLGSVASAAVTPNRRPLKSRETRWAKVLAQALARRRVSPNAISTAGIVFATGGALAFAANGRFPSCHLLWLPLAALGIQLRLVCNLLDGLVAVEGGLKSRGGDLFNEAPDRYEDAVLLAAAGLACGHPALGWMAATGAVLTAYARAFGASLGHGQDFCGPLAKQQRMFWLTVGAVAGAVYLPVLVWALYLIAAGAFVTAGRRVLRLYAKMP